MMKTIQAASILLILTGVATSKGETITTTTVEASSGTTGTRSITQNTEITTVKIPVTGMSCAACVARASKALRAIDGVDDVTVSLADREALIRFRASKVTPASLVQTIDDLGYKAGSPAVSGKK